jgi:glycosyltransferase involved in cell wall biosynthesis
MKWLIIQSNGEHPENRFLRECFAIKYALEKNNEDVVIWGKGHSNYPIPPNFKSFDNLLIIENYNWLPPFDFSGPRKIHWIIDLHNSGIDGYKEVSKHCDIILHSTESLIQSYKNVFPNKKHIWFPNGVDSRHFYMRPYLSKRIQFSFVGNKGGPERQEFITKLGKDLSMEYYHALGNEMIDIISSTKVHFNKNASCDINYRTWETLGLGACLVTNYNPEMEKLGLVDYDNCLFYNTYEECVEKVKYALEGNTWLIIAYNGNKLAQEHSYINRIKNLLKVL